MRVRRANDRAMKRSWRRQIGDIPPASTHEAFVFEAIEAAAEEWCGHARCMQRLQRRGKMQASQKVAFSPA